MRRILCVLALCYSLAWPASSWAQGAPWLPTVSPPGASGAPSSELTPQPQPPSTPSASLSGASSELGSIADELETLLSGLRASLQRAGISLDASGQSLESSIRYATASIDSLAQARADLATAAAQARRRSLEAALWRTSALSAGLGLAGGLLDPRAAQGCAAGAAFGALVGAVWWAAESWPWRIKL